jgi:GAF domain-containing protein
MENLSPRFHPNSLQLTELLSRLGHRWQRTSDLEAVLTAAVTEICSFLRTDCVQICQQQSEGPSQVLAEFRRDRVIPSVFSIPSRGEHVPAAVDEILEATSNSCIIDVTTQRVRQNMDWGTIPQNPGKTLQINELSAAQAETLASMGVRSSLLVPLRNDGPLWGMIVVYHSFPRVFINSDLEMVQLVADYLGGVISQSDRQTQADSKYHQAISIDEITRLLHVSEPLDLDAALEATVRTFQGIGGRLYLAASDSQDSNSADAAPNSALSGAIQLYTQGVQTSTTSFTKYSAIEQYQGWQTHFAGGDESAWGVSDVFLELGLRQFEAMFEPTPIRSLLVVNLSYQQRSLGYLTIFRGESEGESSSSLQPWTPLEVETAEELGIHFVASVQRLHEQMALQTRTIDLEQQLQQQTDALRQLLDRQQFLLRTTQQIRQPLHIDTIIRSTTQELCSLINAERMALYRFNSDWGGQFVNDFEFASNEWNQLSKMGVDLVWNDTYLQETRGGRYRFKETLVVSDVRTADFSPCHLEILEQYKIRAQIIVPIFSGTQLWGLLAAYHHSGPREWVASDVEFLNHVSDQLGIAIHQAELMGQSHTPPEPFQMATDRRQLMLDILMKIRQLRDVEAICRTTTQELCQAVRSDRVAVYRFNADWSGEFINDFEFATREWNGLKQMDGGAVWIDSYLQEMQGGRYRHREISVIDDMTKVDVSVCHLELLDKFQIQAQAIAPIFVGEQLWGLLALYQHSGPRHWDADDTKFLSYVAEQMGAALQRGSFTGQMTVYGDGSMVNFSDNGYS